MGAVFPDLNIYFGECYGGPESLMHYSLRKHMQTDKAENIFHPIW